MLDREQLATDSDLAADPQPAPDALLIDIRQYTLQRAMRTHCTHCDHYVFLLAERRDNDSSSTSPKRLPWFYLCSHCGATAQVGVGPIRGREDAR